MVRRMRGGVERWGTVICEMKSPVLWGHCGVIVLWFGQRIP